ncbi:MAG: hypothetical protein P8107_15320 [Spirochaetia bacterium]
MAIIKWKRDDLYNPWSELDRLQDEINDLFDLDRLPSTSGLFDRPVSPAIDGRNHVRAVFSVPFHYRPLLTLRR